MKLKPEHVEYIRGAMMRRGDTPTLTSYTSQGLSEKRWRWDWMWSVGLSHWIGENIYSYANDEHIDTALRHITKGMKC